MSTYHAFVHGFLSSDSHPGQLASETSKHLTTLNNTHSQEIQFGFPDVKRPDDTMGK
jgi:hypothetical protein